MRTRRGLLLALLLIPFAANAEEITTSPEQAKKAIRELKLSEDYVYAEATTPISISDAQQNSRELLQIYVVGILTERLNLKKKDIDSKWEAIEAQCRNITIKNGDLFKVFTYIEKGTIFPDWKKKEPEPQLIVTAPPIAEVTAEAVAAIPVAQQVLETTEAALPDKIHPMITSLLAQKTFNDLVTLLEKEKAEGRLTYGSMKNIPSPHTSYLIVFKKDNPVIVLGPGTDQRTNLRTNVSDSIMKYVGYSIIWFQLF